MNDWTDRAACRGRAPELDTFDRERAGELIAELCHACPVLVDCRARAEQVAAEIPAQPTGVWGGALWLWGRRHRGGQNRWSRSNARAPR